MLKNKLVTICICTLFILAIGTLVYKTYVSVPDDVEQPLSLDEEASTPRKAPVFVWSYEEDDSLNIDGRPNINVSLEATYPDGTVVRKSIDTTAGGCNDLPDAEEDSVLGSVNAQCYSAGFGYRYKVTEGKESYLVQRKAFEEAQPDYELPAYAYEVVEEFPLSD